MLKCRVAGVVNIGMNQPSLHNDLPVNVLK
jgi:hypothetical protein